MDIYILDEAFDIVDIIDDFEGLIWDTSFFKRGFFELKVPVSRLSGILKGRYVYRSDSIYTGRIDTISIDGLVLTVSGSFLESLLDFRVDIAGREFSGCVETAMHNLVRDNALGARAIHGLTLGTDKQRGVNGIFSAFGKGLAEYFYSLAEAHNLSFNVRYIPEAKKLEFNVIEGLNRTQSQNINAWCVFSQEMENVDSENYETNTHYPNFAYVLGENRTGSTRVRVEVDETNGEERRELFVDASDLQQLPGMNNAVYAEMLKQRGHENLIEAGRFETVDFVVSPDSDMVFGLGDICTYRHTALNKVFELQVTEIKETHEKGRVNRNVVLGRYNLGIVETIRKGVTG